MDYQRIYGEFIASRRERQYKADEYTECHHIVPRCLGGGDEADNLIRLVPDDHFFAHLLLARIHGGKLSAALLLLVQVAERHWGCRHSSRRAYGLARRIAVRALSAGWLAEKNPLFNATVYDWENRHTGERCKATLYAMHAAHGGARGGWTLVAAGRRPSLFGWRIAGATTRAHSEKGRSFSFVNRDGRTFDGTQGQFASVTGINLASASRVVRHGSVTTCGWRLASTADRPANWAKDGLPSRKRRLALSET